MIKKIIVFAILLNILTIAPSFAKDFSGNYKYKDSDMTNNIGDQNFIITNKKGILSGTFWGAESAGEGCSVYFKVHMNNLKMEKNGLMTFVVKKRALYDNRKKIGQKEDGGFSNAELKFSGKFNKDSFTLECKSESGFDCYTTHKMIFKKN